MSDELYYTDDWGGGSDYTADPDMTYHGDESWLPTELGGIPIDQLLTYAPEGLGYDPIAAAIDQWLSSQLPQENVGSQTVARVEAPEGSVSQQPVGGINAVSQAMTSGAPEKSILERFASALTPTAKTNPYAQISEKDMQAMAPRDRAMFQMLQAQYEAKQPSTFERLLQLGLAGGSALASYSGAQSANKERERIAKLQEQQMADYNAAKQRLNMPGGYASLKPASVAFKPLA
jgi:hypothetical protein